MPDIKPKMLVLSMFPALEKPAKDAVGFKFVLFQIKVKDYVKGFEYGYANWNGTSWDEVDPSATVVKWAELPDPHILL